MRADITEFMRSYGRPKPPKKISQEAYEFKTDHLRRLMSCNNELPEAGDLHNYAEDIAFVEEIQTDLFIYLLPVYLRTWRSDLMSNDEDFDNGAGVFLLTHTLARQQLLHRILKPKQVHAVMVFMRDSILDRIDQEDNLVVTPHNSNQANGWLSGLGDFAVIFPDLPSLWQTWWTIETPGQAVAALQYLSVLMYEDDLNPIYVPWTKQHGGGPPGFGSTNCLVDRPWQAENVSFLQRTLTADFFHEALERAAATLSGVADSPVPTKMLSDFESQRPVLESRLQALPGMLSEPF